MGMREDVERWREWAIALPEPVDLAARDAQRGIVQMANALDALAESVGLWREKYSWGEYYTACACGAAWETDHTDDCPVEAFVRVWYGVGEVDE